MSITAELMSVLAEWRRLTEREAQAILNNDWKNVAEQQHRKFKRLIGQLKGPDQVFEIRLDPTEKPITIRQRLLRVAAEANVEIAVRKHGEGFLVGLLTPERRTNRGRRAATPQA